MLEITISYVAFVIIFLAGIGTIALVFLLNQLLSTLMALLASTAAGGWLLDLISQLFK